MSSKNFFDKYAPYFSLGLEIAVGIALPILLGYWLDIQFGILPWLTIAGSIVGVLNVFTLIIKTNKDVNEEE